jgi:UDP-glucose 4-epimerase
VIPKTWVVGRGLLGASVQRTIGDSVWMEPTPIAWDQPGFEASVTASVQAFGSAVENCNWQIIWCAGAGVVGTSKAELATETTSLRFFLNQLTAHPAFRTNRGLFFLSSSAGGVHAGADAMPITEASQPAPVSDYGRAKLEQETMLIAWAESLPNVSTIVGRFANLFGPGQRLNKPQGLISQLSLSMIYGVPAHIFVSLDTIRDYLFSDDAGRMVAATLESQHALPAPPRHLVKIFGSEAEISIAGLLGVFRRLGKRPLRVISCVYPQSAVQPRRLQFRSSVLAENTHANAIRRTDLLDGISRVYQHQLTLFQNGQLPPPPRRN